MLRIHLDSTLKTIVLIWSFLVACLLGCDSPDSTPPKPRPTPKGMAGKIKEKSQIDLGSSIVVLKTEKGDIEIELFAKIAPKTVANFASKIGGKLYDNTSFHRVEKESLIQASSRFQALETIPLEISDRKHLRGSVAMAKEEGATVSDASDFYICLRDFPDLDGNYTVFGQVTKGMAVADRIIKGDKITTTTIQATN